MKIQLSENRGVGQMASKSDFELKFKRNFLKIETFVSFAKQDFKNTLGVDPCIDKNT